MLENETAQERSIFIIPYYSSCFSQEIAYN